MFISQLDGFHMKLVENMSISMTGQSKENACPTCIDILSNRYIFAHIWKGAGRPKHCSGPGWVQARVLLWRHWPEAMRNAASVSKIRLHCLLALSLHFKRVFSLGCSAKHDWTISLMDFNTRLVTWLAYPIAIYSDQVGVTNRQYVLPLWKSMTDGDW